MINLKGYEYELVIQALELPGNNADELFKALIEIAKEFVSTEREVRRCLGELNMK